MPHTTSVDIFFTRQEIKSTNPIASIDPANAATIMPSELIVLPISRRVIIVSATTSFAPDEMPST